jgi:hypothetical protein
MDQRPFFRFDLLDYRPSHLAELSKFASDKFDLQNILTTASTLKYSSAIQQEIAKEMEEPSDEIIKIFASRVYDGFFTKRVRDDFRPIAANAFKEAFRELVSRRLISALEATNERAHSTRDEELSEPLQTTEEEIEAFHIVKSILRTVVNLDRVVMRDSKSYCAILLDDNNRKPIIRLHFNRANKYISLVTSKQEERIRIGGLDEIYSYAERLCNTANEYAGQ